MSTETTWGIFNKISTEDKTVFKTVVFEFTKNQISLNF